MADRPGPDEGSSEGRALLEQLIASDADLEAAFESLLGASDTSDEPSAAAAQLRGVIPGDALGTGNDSATLAGLLTSVAAEYEDIEAVLEGLHEASGEHDLPDRSQLNGDAVAFVSSEELSDPEVLVRVLEPLQSESSRLEVLFGKVRHGLDRLDIYRLSQRSPEDLLDILQREQNLRTVQALVEFLRTLTLAADTFEALELPRPHIRDYLRHLYTMGDWKEMRRLVDKLESTVRDLP